MPITNRTQAEALAAVIQQIRTDWDHPGILKHLHQHRANPATYADIVTAATTKAADPTTRTPALLLTPGNHWPTTSRHLQPKPDPCPDHPEEPATNCRACRADTLAGIRPNTHIGKHYPIPPTY